MILLVTKLNESAIGRFIGQTAKFTKTHVGLVAPQPQIITP